MTLRTSTRESALSTLNDAELVAALGTSTTTGGSRIREVMAEVFARHHGAVLAYARRYCRDPQTAQDLAAEAYASTYQSVARGRGPRHAWRPYLMACVRRTAMEWSAQITDRVLLAEDFHTWADRLADEAQTEGALLAAEETALVARAYRALPERWQVLLWFFVVEGESAATVAQRMSLTPSGVRSLAARARTGLREAYLNAHVDEGTGLECHYFVSLLTGTARRPGRRRGRELARHLEECPGCGRVAEEFRRANHRIAAPSPAVTPPEGVRPRRVPPAGPAGPGMPVRADRAERGAERADRADRAPAPSAPGRQGPARPPGARRAQAPTSERPVGRGTGREGSVKPTSGQCLA